MATRQHITDLLSGATNGFATLDGDGKIPMAQITSGIVGGSASIMNYTFTGTTTATDPTSGYFKFDNATQSGATNIYINCIDVDGIDRAINLENLTVMDVLLLRGDGDTDKWQQVQITGTPVDNTGWFTIPITVLGSGENLVADNLNLISVLSTHKVYNWSTGSTITTTADTPILVTGTSITPDAGRYLCLFNTTVKNSDANGAVFLEYHFDGTVDNDTIRGIANNTNGMTVQNSLQAVYTFNGNQEIKVMWGDYGSGTGTSTMYSRIFTLIKI